MPEEFVAAGPGRRVKKRLQRMPLKMEKDIPILQIIRDTTFITLSQINSLVGFSEARSQRYYRLQKLRDLELIAEHPVSFPYRGDVYSISQNGILCLEACGLGLLSLSVDSEIVTDPHQIYHFLGLNQVRIRFQNSFPILSWLPDLVLKSNNLVSGIRPTAKDYDAVMDLELEPGRNIRLGIEYERTIKAKERYTEIRRSLNNENLVAGVLYFTESDGSALFLLQNVYSQTIPVGVVTTAEMLSKGKEATVRFVQDNKLQSARLNRFLLELRSER